MHCEDTSLADLGNERSDRSRAHMAVVVVKCPPRLYREKSIAEANVHQLIDERAQHIDEMVCRILMVRVNFQRPQQTLNGLVELAFAQVQETQVAMSCGVLWIGV